MTTPDDAALRTYADFEHRVLIVLLGTSPAVLTETLYALVKATGGKQFIPTKVVVITTTEGRKLLNDTLLTTDGARYGAPIGRAGRRVTWLHRLCEDLEIAPITLGNDDIVVPQGPDCEEIHDAHSEDELNAMADAIVDALCQYTTRANTAVHLSLSGGRKSMGHLAGQAMTALARPFDRLIHVIVKPAWLEQPEVKFFYPGCQLSHSNPSPDTTKNKRKHPTEYTVSTADDPLQLSYEPFILLPTSLRKLADQREDLSFNGLIAALSDPPDWLMLELSRSTGDALLGGQPLEKVGRKGTANRLEPKARAYLLTLAQLKHVSHPLTDDEATVYAINYWRISPGMSPDATKKICTNLFVPKTVAEIGDNQMLITRVDADTIKQYFILQKDRNKAENFDTVQLRRDYLDREISALRHAIANCLPPLTKNVSAFDIRVSKSTRCLPAQLRIKWID